MSGERYRDDNPNESYETCDVYPDPKELAKRVSKENVAEWLKVVKNRVDIPALYILRLAVCLYFLCLHDTLSSV